jgi:hypothetical protein
LFVPAERQEATDETVVTFRETSANPTPAIQFWFYPGERIGKEFIYPKDQALRIAQRSGGTVLSEEGRVTADPQTSAAPITASGAERERTSTPPENDAREAAVRTEEDRRSAGGWDGNAFH